MWFLENDSLLVAYFDPRVSIFWFQYDIKREYPGELSVKYYPDELAQRNNYNFSRSIGELEEQFRSINQKINM